MSIDDMKTIFVYEDKVISEQEAIKVVGEILKKEGQYRQATDIQLPRK